MLTRLSRTVFHPLWDAKDGGIRFKTLRDLMRTQWLSAAELNLRQQRKLRDLVLYAYHNTEYYKNLLDGNDISPMLQSSEQFSQIPFLTKAIIRQYPHALISRQYREYELVVAKTGGSTGKALTVRFDKKCQGIRNAAAMRADGWAGCEVGMKKVALWGNPPEADTWKKKLRGWLLDRVIYLDTMNLNPHTMAEFVTRWHTDGPQVLYGHAHSLYILARFLRSNDIVDIPPTAIISTSMTLLAPERRLIEEVFSCKIPGKLWCRNRSEPH